jgi:hypothetical protein
MKTSTDRQRNLEKAWVYSADLIREMIEEGRRF